MRQRLGFDCFRVALSKRRQSRLFELAQCTCCASSTLSLRFDERFQRTCAFDSARQRISTLQFGGNCSFDGGGGGCTLLT